MNLQEFKAGDYVYNAGRDSEDARVCSRQVMQRNGCKTLRFELREREDSIQLVCHGYVAALQGQEFIAVQ